MQLPGHPKSQDDDVLPGEDVDLTLCVETGGEHLDHRGRLPVDAVGQWKHVRPRGGKELREAAIRIAAEQLAVRTQVSLADTAVETDAAIELRIDDDPVAAAEWGAARLDDLARHLVPHDAGIADRNGSLEDLVVGAADAAVRHPHEHVVGCRRRPRDLVQNELAGRGENHGPHELNSASAKCKVQTSK